MLVHPPRVFNIILIDRVTIDLVDQMYLNQELGKFVAKLPPGVPFAVFARGGDHVMMLANFTSARSFRSVLGSCQKHYGRGGAATPISRYGWSSFGEAQT